MWGVNRDLEEHATGMVERPGGFLRLQVDQALMQSNDKDSLWDQKNMSTSHRHLVPVRSNGYIVRGVV